jgi:hypothetical protein
MADSPWGTKPVRRFPQLQLSNVKGYIRIRGTRAARRGRMFQEKGAVYKKYLK